MKRLLPLFLAFLLLTACAAPAERQTISQDSPTASETPPVSEEQPDPQENAPITVESLRAEYETMGFTVREIVPYAGDFLVYCGGSPVDGTFHWVYTDTGLRAPLLLSSQEVLDYEILGTGHIEVLTGGEHLHYAYRYFPVYRYATAVLPLTPDGSLLDREFFSNGSVEERTYWAPLSESHTFGWKRGSASALVDIRITAGGADVVFGPRADSIGDFFAAVSSIPLVTPAYDEAAHTLTLRFHHTALTSGERAEFDDDFDRRTYETAKEIYGLPTDFPAGAVSGSNAFIRSAEVRTDGADTLLILLLAETARVYTAETGQLLGNESRPYLRLSLRDTPSG